MVPAMVKAPDEPTPTPGALPRPPFLPSPESRLDFLSRGYVRPLHTTVPRTAAVHFLVHEGMPELAAYAQARGWPQQGYHRLTTPWIELHWTTDGWATAHVLKSTDVPCPVMNGWFSLPNVAPGTEVEFAVHVGVSCHADTDTAGARDVGELWFNNHGSNYKQHAK